MSKIWNIFTNREKKAIVFLLVTLFVVTVLELFGLVLVIPYVNLMTSATGGEEYATRYPYFRYFFEGSYHIKITIVFCLFYVLKNGTLAILTIVQQTILKRLKAKIMCRMFRYYLHQPYTYHVNTPSSELVRSITYDVNVFTVFILQHGAVLLSEVLLFVGVVVVLMVINPTALLIFIAVILPIVIIYLMIKNKLLLWGKILQTKESEVISHMQCCAGGIKDTLLLGTEEYFESNFKKNVNIQARIKRNADVAGLMPRYTIETLMMISMGIGLFWISQTGTLQNHLSSIAFLAIVSVRILPMSNRIFTAISNIRSATPSLEILEQTARPIDTTKTEQRVGVNKTSFSNLEMSEIEFEYSSDAKVIDGLSFVLKQGEVVGVVGSSGSGKTTFIDILLGLLQPDSGTILCNGEHIEFSLAAWQQRVGYVQQTVFLLDTSIAENIAYGVPEDKINYQRVNEVLKLARLSEWVDSLPDKTNSNVGERGVRISGGQRQRIGIARALYRDPEILVLDEAASSLDNNTEHKIMEDIHNMRSERTIIMIAHRLDSIKRCDRIIVLLDGKIIETGTYDELMTNCEHFQKLANSIT
jgi:ABC-type multidrug transport system fused ATPase/permease subunit